MGNPASGTAAALKAVATGQSTPAEARNPYDQLRRQLDVSKGEFAKLVGGEKNAEKFIRVVLNSVLANPDLLDVTRSSLVGACMRAAQDGLMPDGREAVLNIYNVKITDKSTEPWKERWEKRAQYLPMVGGLIKKMYEVPAITYVDAAVVYRGDVFKFQRGDEPKLIHEPAIDYRDEDLDKGEPVIIAAYAIVKLKNGEIKREVMPRRDIEKVREVSKAQDKEGNPTGPWKDWYDQQAIKSVIKRVYKQLPHTDKLDTAVAHDNAEMHPQTAGAGGSVSDVARPAQAQAKPEPMQALSNDPSDTLQPNLPSRPDAMLQGAQQDQGGEANTLRTRDGAEQVLGNEEPDYSDPTGDDKLFNGPSADELIKRIEGAGDVSIAELVLDESRSLPEPADRARVQDAFDTKWPAKPSAKGKK
jgi:recombination protein RecT